MIVKPQGSLHWVKQLAFLTLGAIAFASCEAPSEDNSEKTESSDSVELAPEVNEDTFEWQTEQFADLKIIRYTIPGWEKLSPKQRQLVYYLNQAGLAGRDIMYDQNYRHNLEIRNALEKVFRKFNGEKDNDNWRAFEIYLKRIWFSNGIHHHYSNTKFDPGFDRDYLDGLLAATQEELSEEAKEVIFDPSIDAKKVELNPDKGLLESSAVNFYAPDVTTDEAKEFYANMIDKESRTPISYGLNSRLAKEDGSIVEQTYKVGGLYSDAITEIVGWLNKAVEVAENDKQAAALRKLIAYYETGDLREWDNYNILWVSDTEGDIDYINGFVEVYNDPLGYRGSYETIVEIKDFDASSRMQTLMENAQWFEDHMPFMEEHKKKEVVGITYNVVNVAGEAGDASPSTPIGVNLPNANWIRAKHGSKSVSLGNIVSAYDKASGPGMMQEFAHDDEEAALAKEHGALGGKLHTALHEVIGHASGKLEDGVGTPKETIQNYASTLEEGRADLIALYFMLDPKLVELGLIPSLDVGKAEYDGYLRNGLLMQLRRIEPGAEIEEAHMRNRAWVSRWVLEKGEPDGVVEAVTRDGNLYYDIKDYEKLRSLFGELLREVQRIKSQGDYEAAKALVEGYGVKVDPDIHQQVLDRAAKLKTAPYGGFINPELVPITDDSGNITDVRVEYPDDFVDQMLSYGQRYSHLSK